VTNYLEERLISHINENFSQRFTLRFCHQKETLGSANALSSTRAAARKYTSTGRPLLISATDYPMPTDYLLELSRFHESHDADISVSLRKISAAKAPHGSRIVESDGELLRIVEKPEDQADGPIIAASLIYIVPPAVFDYADKCPRSKRGEFELPEVINMMIDRGFRAKGFLQQDLIDLDLALHHPSQKCAGHCYPPEDLH
jgi:NDP-sugar pyrophosphorylase family protein